MPGAAMQVDAGRCRAAATPAATRAAATRRTKRGERAGSLGSRQRLLSPFQTEEEEESMNQAVRTGLLVAVLLTPLASAPAPGQSLEPPPAAPATPPVELVEAPRGLDPIATPELWRRAFAGNDAAAAVGAPDGEKRGRRPPPPPALSTFSSSIIVGGQVYPYTMIGTNPELRGAKSVVVPTAIIPVRMVFADGTVLDPSAPSPCLGGLRELDFILQSPLFVNHDYGEGPRQFVEQIRRLEFWNYTAPGKLNPGYSLRLAPTVLPTVTITLPPTDYTKQVACVTDFGAQRFGFVDFTNWFNFLQNQVAPMLPKLGVNASTFVIFEVGNINFTYQGSAVATAYHGTLASQGGMVTYAAAQLGFVLKDKAVNIGAMSHELAEWADDPYGDNPTPLWGNTGQVTSGCQGNLEVGDPLSGTFLPAVQMPNGYSYTVQETAFFSWFFTPAAPCHQ
jgi:hypothetical protein